MRGVLDDLEVMAPGQRPHAGHVPDLATVMNRNNRSNGLAGSQRGLNLLFGIRDIEIEIFNPAIGQDRARAEVTHHLGRGGEGHRRHDDPLPCFKTDGFQREVQSGRAGVDRDGVLVFEVVGELALELFRLRPGREPAAFQGGNHLVDFLGADAGFVEGDS